MDVYGKPILPPTVDNPAAQATKPVESPAPPAPPPPPDKFDPPVATAPPPPPPTGIPTGGHEPPDPLAEGRRILARAEETGDTDELARFLRELRNNASPTVVRGVATALALQARYDHDEGRGSLSRERCLAIQYVCGPFTSYGLPPDRVGD